MFTLTCSMPLQIDDEYFEMAVDDIFEDAGVAVGDGDLSYAQVGQTFVRRVTCTSPHSSIA